jgi:transglutaminase-like putative cysteine protease
MKRARMKPTERDLLPTSVIDSDHESVQSFAHQFNGHSTSTVEQAIALYYAVRDEIRYNPYLYNLTAKDHKASVTLKKKASWCVPKAILLTACCRAIGIPARIGFADVRNHLSTKRMRALMKTDVFGWHGYALLYLNETWVKATPAFNRELCEKFQLKPLDFDGRHDSIYHPFDLKGNQHMEYVRYRGEYDDLPLEEMRESVLQLYGKTSFVKDGSDFDRDVGQEFIN